MFNLNISLRYSLARRIIPMFWLAGVLSVCTVSELTMLMSIGEGSVDEQAMRRHGDTSPV